MGFRVIRDQSVQDSRIWGAGFSRLESWPISHAPPPSVGAGRPGWQSRRFFLVHSRTATKRERERERERP